ncbi:extracellular solute-binding protein [Candidatus Saccharibacteria bacterium]|nr:extracellular solute-binding protein [Candidatus Saccharibacteria bacterium]
MLKKIIIIAVIAVALLGGGVFLFFASRPADTKSDKSGLGAVLAPADNESRVKYTDSPVELTYWRTWNEASAITPAIEAFTKLHPNVKITIRDIDYGRYDDELAQAAKTGNLPDIYSVLNDWVPRYEAYSTPAPETVYTEKVYRDIFVDAVTERLLVNGKIKGVSYGVSTLGLFYNNELLKNAGLQPPKTWEEFVTASRKLTVKSGITITQSGAALGTPFVHQSVDIQSVLMLQNGAQMTDTPPTKATFAQPDSAGVNAGAKALDFYMSFARPDKQNYSFNDTLGYSVKAFAESKVAMMINYPFKSLEVNQFNPELNYTMTKLPQIKGEKEINFAQYWVEMVNKNSTKSEIAWDFIRFAATRDIQEKFSQATLRPTSRKDLVKSQSGDRLLGPFASQTETAKTFYRGNDKEMNGYFYNAIVSVLSGVDPQLALQNTQTRASELLKQYPSQ